MAAKSQHDYAVFLFQQGRYADAILHFDELLQEQQTGEMWSDWATAQFALSQYKEAERGFRPALKLTPGLTDAAVNFGAMLAGLNRWREAIDMLEGVLPKLQPEERSSVSALVEQCRAQLAPVAESFAMR